MIKKRDQAPLFLIFKTNSVISRKFGELEHQLTMKSSDHPHIPFSCFSRPRAIFGQASYIIVNFLSLVFIYRNSSAMLLTMVAEPLGDHRKKTNFFELSRISATITDERRQVVCKRFSYVLQLLRHSETAVKARSPMNYDI